jgi:hypothetical protein
VLLDIGAIAVQLGTNEVNKWIGANITGISGEKY